jgi:hypothetical protein
VRYALEMNKQWFSERVIIPGTVIQGLPRKWLPLLFFWNIQFFNLLSSKN